MKDVRSEPCVSPFGRLAAHLLVEVKMTEHMACLSGRHGHKANLELKGILESIRFSKLLFVAPLLAVERLGRLIKAKK